MILPPRRAALALALLTLATPAIPGRALDLTPRVVDRPGTESTAPGREVLFHDGAQNVAYALPAGWTATAESPRAVNFQPASVAQIAFRIELVPGGPLPADEAGSKALRELALASVPKEATEVTVTAEVSRSVAPEGHPGREVTLSYNLYGQAYGRSLFVIPLEKEQLRGVLTAPREQFAKIRQVVRGSFSAWRHVPAE